MLYLLIKKNLKPDGGAIIHCFRSGAHKHGPQLGPAAAAEHLISKLPFEAPI